MTSLDEKFIDFCDLKSSYKIGGVNDIYSEEQTDYFQLNVQTFADEEKIEFVERKIQEAEIINKEVRNLTLNFDSVYKKGEINVEGEEGEGEGEEAQIRKKIIQNTFPIGKKNFYRPKLENLTKSADIYSELCQQLFKDVFDGKSDELKSIFGSLADYPIIDVDSFGLMPIKDLKELFDEFYLKYEVTSSGKSFKKGQFFSRFLDLLGLNKENIKPTQKEITDYILDDIYFNHFNPEIWYNPEKALQNFDFDAYGYFDCQFKNNPDTLFCFLKFSNDINLRINRKGGNPRQTFIQVKNKILEEYENFKSHNRIDLDDNYNYKRIKDIFSAKNFKDSLDKFFQLNENEKYTINQEFLDEVIKVDTPYIDINIEIEVFKKIRYLFHFSNIYTTYSILLSHFFQNIYYCYGIYLNYIRNFRRKTNKNNSNYEPSELDEIQRRLPILLNELKKIPESFDYAIINLSDVEQSNQQRFYTDNIVYFYRGFINPFNIFITKYRINSDSFKQILQRFFKENKNNENEENKLIVGGIPFVLKEKPKFNKLIILCYSYFLKYRILSNKNYHELLLNYQTQIEQKVSLEDSKVINSIVDKKIEEIQEALLGINLGEYFERCKKILEISISFVLNLSIITIKNLKIKNKKISQTDMNYKIGELKESIYQYMRELYKEILKLSPNYNIFHEFLLGYLLQYIYVFENYNKNKDERVFEKFEEFLSIANKNRAASIKKYSQNITKILTHESARDYKQRFFIGRRYEKLGTNAKRVVTNNINPEIYTSFYWTNYEEKFVSKYGKKLFVIALEPVVSVVEKIAKVNVWLIDVFATAKSFGKPITRSYVKTIEEVDNNYRVIKERYSNDNNMILLNPFFRTIREFSGWLQKKISRGDTLAKKLHSFEFGHLLGKYLGIREKKLNKKTIGASVKDEDYGYTRAEIMRLLINGQLLAYTEDNKDTKIDIGLLMGYDNKQLDSILQEYYKLVVSKGTGKFGTKFKKYRTDMENKTYEDWQLYIIKKGDYESIDKMREWTNNLLNSKPWIFIEDYAKKNRIIPLSNFSKMQAPFERYFIKAQAIHRSPFAKSLPDLLLHIYDMVYQKNFRSGKPNITKKLEKRFFSTETFFDFVLPIDYENRIKGISSNKLLSNKQQNGYLANNEGDDDNDGNQSFVRRIAGYNSKIIRPSISLGNEISYHASQSRSSRIQSQRLSGQRAPVRLAPKQQTYSSFNPLSFAQAAISSSLGIASVGKSNNEARQLRVQLAALQQAITNRDRIYRERQSRFELQQQRLIEELKRRETASQQERIKLEQEYKRLLSQSSSNSKENRDILLKSFQNRIKNQQHLHEQQMKDLTRQIKEQYDEEKNHQQRQLEESREQTIQLLHSSIAEGRSASELEKRHLEETISQLNLKTKEEIQKLDEIYEKRIAEAIARVRDNINPTSGRGTRVRREDNQLPAKFSLRSRFMNPSEQSEHSLGRLFGESSLLSQNTNSADKLLNILAKNFGGKIEYLENNCVITVENDKYTFTANMTRIIYTDLNIENYDSIIAEININKNGNEEVFTAKFDGLFIIGFEVKSNQIFKFVISDYGRKFRMYIKLNTSREQQHYWDYNFEDSFTTRTRQLKDYFNNLFVTVFKHLFYQNGFSFYTVQEKSFPILLDIKGGNKEKTNNIIKLIITPDIFLVTDSGVLKFERTNERFYHAKVNDKDIYLFDLEELRIYNSNGINIWALSWNEEEYYYWTNVKMDDERRKEMIEFIKSINLGTRERVSMVTRLRSKMHVHNNSQLNLFPQTRMNNNDEEKLEEKELEKRIQQISNYVKKRHQNIDNSRAEARSFAKKEGSGSNSLKFTFNTVSEKEKITEEGMQALTNLLKDYETRKKRRLQQANLQSELHSNSINYELPVINNYNTAKVVTRIKNLNNETIKLSLFPNEIQFPRTEHELKLTLKAIEKIGDVEKNELDRRAEQILTSDLFKGISEISNQKKKFRNSLLDEKLKITQKVSENSDRLIEAFKRKIEQTKTERKQKILSPKLNPEDREYKKSLALTAFEKQLSNHGQENIYLTLPNGRKQRVSQQDFIRFAQQYLPRLGKNKNALTKKGNTSILLKRENINRLLKEVLREDENGKFYIEYESQGNKKKIYLPIVKTQFMESAVEVFNNQNNSEAKRRANLELKIKKIIPTLPKNTFLERLPPNNINNKSKKVFSNDNEISEEIKEEEEQVETNYYLNNFNSNSKDSDSSTRKKKISSQSNSRIGAAAALHNVDLGDLSSSSNPEIQFNKENTYNNPVNLSKYTSHRTNYRNPAIKVQSAVSLAAPSSPFRTLKNTGVANPSKNPGRQSYKKSKPRAHSRVIVQGKSTNSV